LPEAGFVAVDLLGALLSRALVGVAFSFGFAGGSLISRFLEDVTLFASFFSAAAAGCAAGLSAVAGLAAGLSVLAGRAAGLSAGLSVLAGRAAGVLLGLVVAFPVCDAGARFPGSAAGRFVMLLSPETLAPEGRCPAFP
jgi:hypothetical protein